MGLLVDLLIQSPSSVILLGAAVLLLVLFFLYRPGSQEQGMEPPGPRPLPLLGNLLLLDLKRPYVTLFQLSKKYGSVFTVHFGPKKVVVLAGYKTVKQALVNHAEEFGDREIHPIFKDLNEGHGIIFTNGDTWTDMRRFALTNLRDFGMGKRASEEKIIEESHKLIEVIAKYEGKDFDNAKSVMLAASNIICSIIYGSRFEYEDPEFRAMVNRSSDNMRLIGSSSILLYNTFPWLGTWIGNRNHIMENLAANKKQMTKLISALQDTLNPQMCRGFVDAFLAHKQKLKKSGNVNTHFHKENLLATLGNLFAAGTDTTATTLKWSLLLMAKYPHIQVFPLLASVHWDESEWEKPHTFYPAHFLDKDGHFVKRDAFMPFSAGRRMCPGEALARMELFLFFTSLLQHFRFTPAPGITEDELDLSPMSGSICNPPPHKLCAISRI